MVRDLTQPVSHHKGLAARISLNPDSIQSTLMVALLTFPNNKSTVLLLINNAGQDAGNKGLFSRVPSPVPRALVSRHEQSTTKSTRERLPQ